MSGETEPGVGEPDRGDLAALTDGGPGVHIHKPKPLHGMREIATEIGVIVIGIFIALASDEALRVQHDRQTAREARDAVYTEIRQNLSYLQGRSATQDCVERRLDEIGDILEKSGDGPLSPRPNWVGQPSVWFMASQRWDAATGSGRTSLLTADEQGRLATSYVLTTRFAQAEAHEQAAWAQLRGLESWTGPLGPVGRVHFLPALQDARYELWNTRISMKLAFQSAKALGIKDYGPETMGSGYKIPHAVCIPITTTRAQALKLLEGNSPPWGQPK